MTNENLQKLKDMYNSGECHVANLAEHFCCTKKTIYHNLKKLGIEPAEGCKMTEKELEKLKLLYDSGDRHVADLAEYFHCSKRTIYHNFKKLGLEPKDEFRVNPARKYQNLIGQHFDMLKILLVFQHKKRMYAQCQCECGTIKDIQLSFVLNGTAVDCGRHSEQGKDLTGDKHGMLTVIQKTNRRNKFGQLLWLCQCECGKTTEITSSEFSTNTSCGCSKYENIKEHMKIFCAVNLVENTNLSVISKQTPNKNNTSGVRGVSFVKATGKWKAAITFQGSRYFLGDHDTLEDAAAARKRAEEIFFKPVLDKYDIKLEIKKIKEAKQQKRGKKYV